MFAALVARCKQFCTDESKPEVLEQEWCSLKGLGHQVCCLGGEEGVATRTHRSQSGGDSFYFLFEALGTRAHRKM